MSKQKKNGFTLVELLAVIVILAVILVIAVPSIMDTIKESRKGALASSAKLIASSAETAYISNQTLGIEKNITCSDVSSYTEEDYICSLEFVDGKAQVTLEGKGKFEGMYVCGGTKEEAEVRDGNDCPIPAVKKIESLATTGNKEGLTTDDTDDHNIRYSGNNVKNYVEFGNDNPKELWRIIGIFEVTTVDENTKEKKPEKLMKIVRDSQFSTTMSWDSSASDVNRGYGVNEWSQADLMTMLNTYYIGTSTTCSYCDIDNVKKCSRDCSSIKQIKSPYREMIENVEWNTGAIEHASSYGTSIDRKTAYNAERETKTGKICESGTYCNDSVTRTITWTGKVGLIYPSDYGYASTSDTDIKSISIGTTNWLKTDSDYWTLSPLANSDLANFAWHVLSGCVDYGFASSGIGVRPAIYLKSDVSITSGDGTYASPYKLSMN